MSGEESYGPEQTSTFAYRDTVAIGVVDDYEQAEDEIPALLDRLFEDYMKLQVLSAEVSGHVTNFKDFSESWLKHRRIKACKIQATQVTLLFDDGRRVNLIPGNQTAGAKPRVIPVV